MRYYFRNEYSSRSIFKYINVEKIEYFLQLN